eukprot:CAMPEP_0198419468 /NCGR_PEP_ID=MMETSP1452-20131203/233_1 /TAXON_ID=1181717 /ORGANISM="Synchroma pusillum, Strain CCMP3072" /LENGTH=249 /DNA_ID=CAMNT_0044139599 /DNA_START=60 /DNA_END=809 /DNA_ORIENTATION=+
MRAFALLLPAVLAMAHADIAPSVRSAVASIRGGAGDDGDEFLSRISTFNRAWSSVHTERDATYFAQHTDVHRPTAMLITCCDARVPIAQSIGAAVGEVFTYRNVANICQLTDLSMMAAVQYAVEVLLVDHIIVCGHSNCGGVKEACRATVRDVGHPTYWLEPIRELIGKNSDGLKPYRGNDGAFTSAVVELNARQQAANLLNSPIVARARETRGSFPHVHSAVYDISSGQIKVLEADMQPGQKIVPVRT